MPSFYSLAPMVGDPGRCQGIIEVSEKQLKFLEALSYHRGNMLKAYEIVPCTEEAKLEWVADLLFWNAALAVQRMMLRSQTLTVDFVRDHMVSAATGETKPTRVQMQAINLASRVLGLGLANNGRGTGKVSVKPDEIQITFNDGQVSATLPSPCQENAPQAIPGPLPIDVEHDSQGELK